VNLLLSDLVEYDLFHIFDVAPHGGLGSLGIVVLDRSQDAAVAGQ
jgi:hypothetical protein